MCLLYLRIGIRIYFVIFIIIYYNNNNCYYLKNIVTNDHRIRITTITLNNNILIETRVKL